MKKAFDAFLAAADGRDAAEAAGEAATTATPRCRIARLRDEFWHVGEPGFHQGLQLEIVDRVKLTNLILYTCADF